MELNKDLLHSLIKRSWTLQMMLNNHIKNSNRLCRYCSEHGQNRDDAETPYEGKLLIAIRESLNEVQNSLMFLERLQCSHLKEKHIALVCLEQRRSVLVENVIQYKGRPLDVVRELKECFGNQNPDMNWNFKEGLKKKTGLDCIKRKKFLTCCIRKLIPWKWENCTGIIAVKLLMVGASISSMVQFYQFSSRKRESLFLNSTARMRDNPVIITEKPIHVFYGRG